MIFFFVGEGGGARGFPDIPYFKAGKKHNGQLCTKPQVKRFQWSKVKIGRQLAAQTYPTGITQETFKA